MEIMVAVADEVMVLTPRLGYLDASNTKEFKEVLVNTIDGASKNKIVMDMSSLKFIDSSGLGTLVTCLRLMNSNNGELKLAGVTKAVRAILEIVRMHRLFEIFDSTEDAVRSFRAG